MTVNRTQRQLRLWIRKTVILKVVREAICLFLQSDNRVRRREVPEIEEGHPTCSVIIKRVLGGSQVEWNLCNSTIRVLEWECHNSISQRLLSNRQQHLTIVRVPNSTYLSKQQAKHQALTDLTQHLSLNQQVSTDYHRGQEIDISDTCFN